MSAKKVLGPASPVVTEIVTRHGDTLGKTVTIEGKTSDLEALSADQINSLLPTGFGYAVDSWTVSPNGPHGLGKLVADCLPVPDTQTPAGPNRTTYRISMESVTYDLLDHPNLGAGSRNICEKWLATDESARYNGTDFFFADAAMGQSVQIQDNDAIKFCKAFMAGIKTFNRYYPVIEKISYWDSPPGVTKSERSYAGGTFTQFSTAGKWENTDIVLAGYPSTNHWYKSGDDWVEGADRQWTRTEQWTYTPDGADGDHGWIYGTAPRAGLQT